ncbi:MAG: ATPase, T2SS/T4P/T4SS family [Acidobacteriota bacterium]
MATAACIETDTTARILGSAQALPRELLDTLLQEAETTGRFLEELLLERGQVDESLLRQYLENHYFCSSLSLPGLAVEAELLTKVTRKEATRHLALPIRPESGRIVVAFANPDDTRAREAIARALQSEVQPVVALRHELRDAIGANYARLDESLESDRPTSVEEEPAASAVATDLERVATAAEGWLSNTFGQSTAVEIVDLVLADAAQRGVTDIHVEVDAQHLRVRHRIDGLLQLAGETESSASTPVVTRLKVLSGLDIAEKRAPQDGRFSFQYLDEVIDVRSSTLPSQFGEKVVLRLLRKDCSLLDINKLEMPAPIRERMQDLIDNPLGFYLVTGPTGSGKTTSLYATMAALDRPRLNVVTLEDPIEYTLPGITQVQVNEAAGLSFYSGLCAMLRQDPNVLLVGEIRDVATAEIACRAALTGHKVFSTLHTNDACQAVTRLTDMGCSPHLIAATLKGVLAQRLLRLICQSCSQPYEANETERSLLGQAKPPTLHRGTGCEACSGIGYKGRQAVFEYYTIDNNAQRLILERAAAQALRHAATKSGMSTMVESGRQLVLQGKTTVSELQRELMAADEREQLCHSCQRVVSADYSHCPFCQVTLREHCPSCHEPVDAAWEACPHCGEEFQREWKSTTCGHCEAVIAPGLPTCPYCGGEQ